MKSLPLNFILFSVALFFFWSCNTTQDVPADLILLNGKIAQGTTEDGFVEAISIKDGIIQSVGNESDVLKHDSDQTQVIDLNGKTVIPGLNDSHTHVVRAGLNYNMEL